MAKQRFPPRSPLRAIRLLQWGIAILSLILELVPLSELAAAAKASPGEAGGAGAYHLGNLSADPSGEGKPDSGEEMQMWGSSDVQDETPSVFNGSVAGPSSSASQSVLQKKTVLLATAIGVMLAIFGAAAHRIGSSNSSVKDRLGKLAKLVPNATGLAEAIDTVDANVTLKFFKSALAAADRAQKGGKEPGQAKKRLTPQQQQRRANFHLVESVSSLRFMIKTARDQADLLAKQAKAVVQPSLPAAEMVETERAVLTDEFVDSYVIIRDCLEKSISRHAKFAEEGSTNMKNLPALASEDDGHLLTLAQRHIEFVKAETTSCGLANNLMAHFSKQLVAAHREFHLNEDMQSFSKIGELHAAMKAHKAMAARALAKTPASALGNLAEPLKEFVDMVENLEKQFEVLAKSFERLRVSNSTTTNVDASTDVTADATKFVEIHKSCALKLSHLRRFFEGEHAAVVEGGKVFKEAIERAYQGSKADHDHMLYALMVVRDRKQSMFQGAVAGFKKPFFDPELFLRVAGGFENMEPVIKEALQEARAHASGGVGKSLPDDRRKLQNITDARIKLASLRKEADEYSASFVLLKSMENIIERSMRVHAAVEEALKSKGKEAPSKELVELMKKFKAGVSQANKAKTLVEAAKATTWLQRSSVFCKRLKALRPTLRVKQLVVTLPGPGGRVRGLGGLQLGEDSRQPQAHQILYQQDPQHKKAEDDG
ncbi:hypothetical protein Emag_005503 [Eimeria magna]